jgi:two-component system response regulator GlrR
MSELATRGIADGASTGAAAFGRSDAGAGFGGDGDVRPAGRRREDRIVAASPAMQRTLDRASLAARSGQPVLIRGPVGSGKSLLARAVHAWSSLSARPLETLLCAAVPEPLQARELFGCAAGTYPALPNAFDGALERAAGGTLLLESVDALAAPVWTVLSRALATLSYRPEGGSEDRPLRARVIATLDRGAAELAVGVPHQDLVLAPLSERREDILPLAAHFLALAAAEAGGEPIGFAPDARTALLEEAWAGNVAELRERVRQAVRLAGGGAVSAEALLLAARGDRVPSFRDAKRAFEARYVESLLRLCEGNISQAARLAKKDRKDFYDVIRRTGVDPSLFRR